ncbi:CHAP domain-containing protein [Candidatus Saccharibacteria bacterium]|nr:CHAP domain-containing protein [Candidatus Saccharibacteria bacterium]
MNTTTTFQRLLLSGHRQQMLIHRNPIVREAKRLHRQDPRLKAILLVIAYFVAFAFFFGTSQAEFEQKTSAYLSTTQNNAKQQPIVQASSKPASKRAIASPTSSTKSTPPTNEQASLPPFNEEKTTAPSTAQQYSPAGYAYGHCTYYVAKRRPIPSNWGNARDWLRNAKSAGFLTGSNPRVGSIAQTPYGRRGHVAYVEKIDGDRVMVSEMNYTAWNRTTTRWASASDFQYIY